MNISLIGSDGISVPRILSIGVSDDPSVTRFGPSRRKQYIIHYVISGEGYFNGRSVKAGEGFLITPELEVEEYHSNPKEPWKYLWIISEDDAMEHYFELHGADKSSGIFKFHNEYVLEKAAHELGENGFSPVSSSLLAEIFLRIFNSSVAPYGRAAGACGYLEFSVGYIRANLHLPITVSGLCEIIGVSQPYLYKVFMEGVGVSPKRYFSKCRIAEAKRLLAETELRVTEIASAVGFSDSLAFSKFFSKEVGASPTKYRNAIRDDA